MWARFTASGTARASSTGTRSLKFIWPHSAKTAKPQNCSFISAESFSWMGGTLEALLLAFKWLEDLPPIRFLIFTSRWWCFHVVINPTQPKLVNLGVNPTQPKLAGSWRIQSTCSANVCTEFGMWHLKIYVCRLDEISFRKEWFQYMGMSENGVYPQWNSHLVGIMISKTIGYNGVHYFQTNPYFNDTTAVTGLQVAPAWPPKASTFVQCPKH